MCDINQLPMPIIDTHIHVWTENSKFPWGREGVSRPRQDAQPETFLELMQAEGVDRAVLVQYIGYLWDNRYVAHVLETFPSSFMAVCRVDPENPNAPDMLSHWTEEYGFRGVRLSPQVDARGDWFGGPLMAPLFRRAAELRVPVLILTKPPRLPDLARILDRQPDVEVIIDHLADAIDGDDVNLKGLLDLARYPQVYLKMGHVSVNSAQSYPWKDTHSLVQRVADAYGAQRLMWGSDWPLCLTRMAYAQSISVVRDEMDFFSRDDLDWVFCRTALRWWPFPGLSKNRTE